MIETKSISEEKKDIVKNLYISGISEEFIAMQIDLEIPVVIAINSDYINVAVSWVVSS